MKQASVQFVTKFENRNRQTFQRRGKRLIQTVTNKDPKGKEKIVLFVAGQGEAVERPATNQKIPYMNAGRSKVELILKAYFAGDPIQWEDLESMELNDIQTIADTVALALGRKSDDVIIEELNGTAKVAGDATKPFSYGMALEGIEEARELHWDEEEGAWFWLLHPNHWSHLMTYKEFANADYVGNENLPFLNKANSRNWMGINFMVHKGLKQVVGNANATRSLLYYGPAIAASGEPAPTDISWMGGQDQQWSIMGKGRFGAKRHEAEACLAVEAATNIALRNAEHEAPSA